MVRIPILLALVLGCASGCGPSISWVQNPDPKDRGLRYYRPKPYILLAPASVAGEPEATKGAGADSRACAYKLSLCYLPDFAEEYSVHLRPGLGTSKLTVNLENGWNLTSVTQDLDSKTSDNLTAAAGLIKAVIPNGLPTAPGESKSKELTGVPSLPAIPDAYVIGHEVPIGYYEAVLHRDPRNGVKRLLGFRYVGFLPFAQGGGNPPCIPNDAEPLYGLVLERGVLIFKTLDQLAEPTRVPVLALNNTEGVAASSPAKIAASSAGTSHEKPSEKAKPERVAAATKPPTPESTPPSVGHFEQPNP